MLTWCGSSIMWPRSWLLSKVALITKNLIIWPKLPIHFCFTSIVLPSLSGCPVPQIGATVSLAMDFVILGFVGMDLQPTSAASLHVYGLCLSQSSSMSCPSSSTLGLVWVHWDQRVALPSRCDVPLHLQDENWMYTNVNGREPFMTVHAWRLREKKERSPSSFLSCWNECCTVLCFRAGVVDR